MITVIVLIGGYVAKTILLKPAPLHLARDLAIELHLDPDDVVLVTRDRLGDDTVSPASALELGIPVGREHAQPEQVRMPS